MRLMTSLALLLLALVASVHPASANPVLLFDAATGEVLLSRDAGAEWHPASLTKLMTAYLTFQSLKNGQLSLDTKLTVPPEALTVSPSKIGLKPGTTITTELALRALLIYRPTTGLDARVSPGRHPGIRRQDERSGAGARHERHALPQSAWVA